MATMNAVSQCPRRPARHLGPQGLAWLELKGIDVAFWHTRRRLSRPWPLLPSSRTSSDVHSLR